MDNLAMKGKAASELVMALNEKLNARIAEEVGVDDGASCRSATGSGTSPIRRIGELSPYSLSPSTSQRRAPRRKFTTEAQSHARRSKKSTARAAMRVNPPSSLCRLCASVPSVVHFFLESPSHLTLSRRLRRNKIECAFNL